MQNFQGLIRGEIFGGASILESESVIIAPRGVENKRTRFLKTTLGLLVPRPFAFDSCTPF